MFSSKANSSGLFMFALCWYYIAYVSRGFFLGFGVFVFFKKSMYKRYKIIILLAVQRHHYECFGKSIISCLEKFSFNFFFTCYIFLCNIQHQIFRYYWFVSCIYKVYMYIYIYTHKIASCEITITNSQAQFFAYTRA